MRTSCRLSVWAVLVLLPLLTTPCGAAPPGVKVLFLGDNGHHRPADRFRQIQPVLAARGITLDYTDRVSALRPDLLARYDALLIYANIERITPAQEKTLIEYVEGGKGFVPLHCASYCFLNSDKYVDLVGARFKRHDTGTFRTTIAAPDHPLMKGFKGFESWDETYQHERHNTKGRTVLEYREKEPWTWVRTQGKGRVFYTAWGHDARTWGNPGFQNLLERGIRWAAKADLSVVRGFRDQPEMTRKRTDVKPFEYVEARVPFYPPRRTAGPRTDSMRKMQKPVSPEESIKHLVHPTDFEVKLFASEPDLSGKPICMNWDERGRLWVALTIDYPNERQPPGEGRDRIVVCEDTDGDGKADKFTTFADRLSIPTSLLFFRGGVIVQQAPDTLFLKDTDGDGKADVRKVLFTGWGTRDTHAGPSNLRWGLDNQVWGIVGYSGFRGRVGGEEHSFGQAFYRFKPDGSKPAVGGPASEEAKSSEPTNRAGWRRPKLEFLRNTSNNSWGVGFSEEGVVFGSTANGNPSVYLPIPNRYYERVRGWAPTVLGTIAVDDHFHSVTDRVRQVDFHGRFTAAAGHALYTARTYPREYWNRTAFVSEPTGHLTATFVIRKQGADFVSRNSWNLLASDDEWTAPIMAEVGPDGNVWVIDWYNYIVQHNPTPQGFRTGKGNAYETSLRDKKHGRIYRLVMKGAKIAPSRQGGVPFSLQDATPARLVAALKNDNMFWRLHAQRLLVERGKKDVVPALLELARDQTVDEIGLNPGAIHALWTLHGLGALNGSDERATRAAVAGLGHPSAGVRRNAVQVLPASKASVKAILDAGLLKDADGQVRLMALLALADMPSAASAATPPSSSAPKTPPPLPRGPRRRGDEAGRAIAEALADEVNSRDRWLMEAATAAAATHDRSFLQAVVIQGKALDKSEAALKVIAIVAEHHARGVPTETVGTLVTGLSSASPGVAQVVLSGLAKGWPEGKAAKLTDDQERSLATLLVKLPVASRGSLVRLARRWGSKALEKYASEIAVSLLGRVRDRKVPDVDRAAAAAQLLEFRPEDAGTARDLLKLITPSTSPELAGGLLDAVGHSQVPEVGGDIVALVPGLTPAVRPAAVALVLGRPAWTRTLLDALEKGKVRLTDLSLDQQRTLSSYPNRAIAGRARRILERGGGLPNPDRQKVLEILLPLAKRQGTAAAGKVVFKAQCAKCHTHSGEGTAIGPDLTGMAVHPREELLTQILDPSRSVEGNFRVYTVSTKKGQVLTGLLASETRTSLEVIDAEGKHHVVQRTDVDEIQASEKSLMPEGFEKQLKPQELVDLLAFLTQRGKYLPIPLGKAATVTSVRGMFYSEDAQGERLVFRDWSPKVFEGVPFQLIDPRGGKIPNVVLLYGPQGKIPPRMPRSVRLPCNAPARAIHLLSGVSGWGYPLGRKGSVSMIVRLHYEDGKTEDHELKNGEHFADYIRRVDVTGSKFAFDLRGRQVRYLAIQPRRKETIREIELVKGPDSTAPLVMAVTAELPE
jgi:uncharacterized protein